MLLLPGVVLAFVAVRPETKYSIDGGEPPSPCSSPPARRRSRSAPPTSLPASGHADGQPPWDSAPFAFLAGHWPALRLPVPADFLTGIDLSLARERALKWRVVILGQQYPRGVWYYFALLWLMKTPVLLLAAEGIGYVRAIRTGILWRSPPLRFLASNLALLLAYFSLLFHAQIGYRFVLMCIPSVTSSPPPACPRVSPPAGGSWGMVVVLSAMAENAAYLGNHLSFTNVACAEDVFRWICLQHRLAPQRGRRLPGGPASGASPRPPSAQRNLLRPTPRATSIRALQVVQENVRPRGR